MKIRKKLIILGLVMLVMVALPVFTLGSRRHDLYVDTEANGRRDGSVEHPYKTIGEAIDKARDNTDIHVANGEYEENITLKNGIRLFGEDKEKTIIKADKSKWSVIYFKEDSEVNGFTLKDGERGIWIDKYAKAEIIDCIIKDNDKDGVGIEGGKDTKKENVVLISNTEIKDNGKAGIYLSGKRKLTVIESEITENDGDGIDLPAGTEAWIADNKIKDNEGSGMKLVLDGANIWTKNLSIRENKREGVEVSSYGASGRINFEKSKMVDNRLFGIARLQRNGAINSGFWNQNLTFGKKVEFWGNKKADVSGIISAR